MPIQGCTVLMHSGERLAVCIGHPSLMILTRAHHGLLRKVCQIMEPRSISLSDSFRQSAGFQCGSLCSISDDQSSRSASVLPGSSTIVVTLTSIAGRRMSASNVIICHASQIKYLKTGAVSPSNSIRSSPTALPRGRNDACGTF